MTPLAPDGYTQNFAVVTRQNQPSAKISPKIPQMLIWQSKITRKSNFLSESLFKHTLDHTLVDRRWTRFSFGHRAPSAITSDPQSMHSSIPRTLSAFPCDFGPCFINHCRAPIHSFCFHATISISLQYEINQS